MVTDVIISAHEKNRLTNALSFGESAPEAIAGPLDVSKLPMRVVSSNTPIDYLAPPEAMRAGLSLLVTSASRNATAAAPARKSWRRAIVRNDRVFAAKLEMINRLLHPERPKSRCRLSCGGTPAPELRPHPCASELARTGNLSRGPSGKLGGSTACCGVDSPPHFHSCSELRNRRSYLPIG
jgi:hypothetical protein